MIGLYVTAINGTPPFASADITFTAETVFTSVAVNRLSNADGTYSLAMATGGINLIGADQSWFLNGAELYGAKVQNFETTGFDVLTRKDYVDNRVDGLLVNQDGYRFAPSGIANAFAIVKLSDSSQPFVIQTDVGSASTITV